MKVHVIYNPNRDPAVRVHAAGCRDIARDVRGATSSYPTEGESQRQVAEDFHADFIGEGSMTADQAMGYTEFLPCTAGLPEAQCPKCTCGFPGTAAECAAADEAANLDELGKRGM